MSSKLWNFEKETIFSTFIGLYKLYLGLLRTDLLGLKCVVILFSVTISVIIYIGRFEIWNRSLLSLYSRLLQFFRLNMFASWKYKKIQIILHRGEKSILTAGYTSLFLDIEKIESTVKTM